MKYISYILLSMFLVLSLSHVEHAQAEQPAETILLYFESVRKGDVDRIKSFLGGNLFNKRKVLLEKNKKYPDFLRNRFGEAKFTVEGLPKNLTDTTKSVLVRISFDDGSSISTNLVVQQTTAGDWKIIDQLRN